MIVEPRNDALCEARGRQKVSIAKQMNENRHICYSLFHKPDKIEML